MQRPQILLMVCVLVWNTVITTTSMEPQALWLRQPLDHFGSKDGGRGDFFLQRYYVDRSSRNDQLDVDGMPIFVFLGGEGPIDQNVGQGGIVTLAAARLQGLVVYIEHRFYGRSIPMGSIDAALTDPYVRSCLTSDQALADFANVITALKANLSIPNSPVVTLGGSYAGMLAARFRMKYPNITNGSLASSAPILMSAELPEKRRYCYIASRDFENENEKCYQHISQSWALIDEVGSRPNGLEALSQDLFTCSTLQSTSELKAYLADLYYFTAQYNGCFNRVSKLCNVISRSSENEILKGIGEAVVSSTEGGRCNNLTIGAAKPFSIIDEASGKAWNWQVCNEFAPHEDCGRDTMFEKTSFDMSMFSKACFDTYKSYPRPHWTSTRYGKLDLKTSTNIIFSNGLMDPYSGASVLEDISESVVAITTKEGSHCLDIIPAADDDPKWLKVQRNEELKIIARWLNVTIPSTGVLRWAISRRLLVAFLLVHVIL